MKSIYNLQYDYEQGNGDYLIVSKTDVLKESDFNNIQVKMLLSNQIPQLLPIEIEEVDFNIRIRYNTTFKTVLSSYIKTHQLNIQQSVQIFLKIITIIDDSKLYMFNERNYLLNSDFIFISKDYSEIFLTYIPLKIIDRDNNLEEEIKQLFNLLFANLADVNNEMYRGLRDFLNKGDFTIKDLKKILIMLIDDKKFEEENPMLHQAVVDKERAEFKNKSDFKSHVYGSEADDSEVSNDRVIEPLTERQNVILCVIGLFLIALIWKGYELIEGESLIYICLGLTILVIDIIFILMKLWRPSLSREDKKNVDSSTNEKFSFKTSKNSSKKISKNANIEISKKANIEIQGKIAKDECSTSKEVIFNSIHPENISEETTLLRQEHKKAYLIIDRGKSVDTIEIDSSNFIIGRNYEVANYVEKARSISRTHIEIIENSIGYEVRDLGSKNGTYLNEELLIPNKLYPIVDGDRLKLAKKEYLFRVDVSFGGDYGKTE